jgi:hypothetical protein
MLPLFFAPSWNFSGRLVPGLGFVPPAMLPSSPSSMLLIAAATST